MANERIGDSRPLFGLTDEPWGYMQAETDDNGVDEVEATDAKGNVAAVEQYNNKRSVTGSYTYYAASVTGPWDEVGSGTTVSITDASLSVYIKKATKNWSVGNWMNISFEGTYWPYLRSS